MKKLLFGILHNLILIHVSYSLRDSNSESDTVKSLKSLKTHLTGVTADDLGLDDSDVLSTNTTELFSEYPSQKSVFPFTATLTPTVSFETNPTNEISTHNILVRTKNVNTSEIGMSSYEFSDRNYYCPCNIIPLICDTNCCCDKQCSKDVLQIFNCQNRNASTDFKSSQYEYKLSSCKINDGWLCIFRTNIQHRKKKNENTSLFFVNNYKWPNPMIYLKKNIPENLNFYKYGEPLILLNMETNNFHKLDIPYAFNSPHCKLKTPLRYLISQTTHCLIDDLEAANRLKHSFLTLLQTTKLLINTKIQSISKEQKKNDLINLYIRRCIDENSLEHCHIFRSLESDKIKYKYENENAFLKEIHFQILHNFTHIQAVTIELKELLLNLTKERKELSALWQTYKVQFILIDMNNEQQKKEADEFNIKYEEKAISGALDYILGTPIIFGKILPYNANETSTNIKKQITFDYFHETEKRLLKNSALRLFNSHKGYCHKTKKREEFINYGVNTLKQCKLNIQYDTLIDIGKNNKSKNINYTNICIYLQEKAWQTLYFSSNNIISQLSDIYISRFGNPKPEPENWTRLQIKNYKSTSITALFDTKTLSFTCQNMILSIFYEFFIYNSDENTISQAIIDEAILIFGSRHDLEFDLNKPIEVPLTTSVMFYSHLPNFSSSSATIAYTPNIIILFYWLNILMYMINKYSTKIL